MTPLSFCADLKQLFAAVKPSIVISYFCGLHTDFEHDSRAKARGVMKSLIGQLLLQGE
jgi:hypothetical protein